MCGILAIIGKTDPELAREISSRMNHRGPDERDIYVQENGSLLSHERLSIIDLKTGKQPIQGTDTAWVVHNGEIYNHQELRDGELSHKTFRTTCDSEVIVHLYEEYGYDFCNKLGGVFAFVVLDGDKFIAGRDPIGVKPLYYGKDTNGAMFFASEMKVIADQCVEFEAFPPGHYYTKEDGLVKYFNPTWLDHKVCTNDLNLDLIRDTLIKATEDRLMTDVPLGVLLSGGLDSSLTSAIAKRAMDKTGTELHSFSVGLNADAPDLIAAREVAAHIKTTHHEVYFSVAEGIKILDKLIWHAETYDVTSIRASTPMYFLSKAIADLGIKVVLSGEGADEIYGGYLYFNNAPSLEEFQKETIDRVGRLSTADCLRADKSTMAHGIEARVPFLDKNFLEVSMLLDPKHKQGNRDKGIIEKKPIRMAFDDKENPFLPQRILWRQKEQFSDGVGYNWIDELIAHAESQVSDDDFATASTRFPHNTPMTKEAFYYRTIFEKHYPQESAIKTVLQWIPKWQVNLDPSGRANNEHVKTYEGDNVSS
ncbi:MAG: asparagine synthase B [Flavobacteriales bacterium]|nr:asparagine synthase B [Flavobacteriales bacterium]